MSDERGEVGQPHVHSWTTRYQTFERYDCASGVECACGATVDQLSLESMLSLTELERAVVEAAIAWAKGYPKQHASRPEDDELYFTVQKLNENR